MLGLAKEVYAVVDCVMPKKIKDAAREAFRLVHGLTALAWIFPQVGKKYSCM
jgi:hypothetical protein